jgi:hypothetical protein
MIFLLRVEAAVLLAGWLSSIGFLLCAGGVFSGSYHWSAQDFALIYIVLILAVPYALMALFCWLLRRFLALFVIASVTMVFAATYGYYGEVSAPDPDGGWVFMMIPALQTFFVCACSGMIFILGKLFKSPPARGVR